LLIARRSSAEGPAWRFALAALRPLDEIRAAVLRAGAPIARPFLRDRGLRVLVYACVAIALAFTVACTSPAFLLAVAPIALGVPHLMADARYLVARRGLHRRSLFWTFVCAPCALVWSSPHVWVGLLATLGAVAIARASVTKKAAGALAVSLLAVTAYRFRGPAEVWMAHAHNLIALVLWVALFRRADEQSRAGRARWAIVIALFAVCSLLFFVLPILPESSARFGVDMDHQALIFSPLPHHAFGAQLVMLFAFAQSVHYAIWLRVIPEEARSRQGVRSFASSLQALRQDLGTFVLVGFVLLALFFVAWALHDLWAARVGYLNLAITHGYLEVAILALVLLERPTKGC
jgi:hypothetical protein